MEGSKLRTVDTIEEPLARVVGTCHGYMTPVSAVPRVWPKSLTIPSERSPDLLPPPPSGDGRADSARKRASGRSGAARVASERYFRLSVADFWKIWSIRVRDAEGSGFIGIRSDELSRKARSTR